MQNVIRVLLLLALLSMALLLYLYPRAAIVHILLICLHPIIYDRMLVIIRDSYARKSGYECICITLAYHELKNANPYVWIAFYHIILIPSFIHSYICTEVSLPIFSSCLPLIDLDWAGYNTLGQGLLGIPIHIYIYSSGYIVACCLLKHDITRTASVQLMNPGAEYRPDSS